MKSKFCFEHKEMTKKCDKGEDEICHLNNSVILDHSLQSKIG